MFKITPPSAAHPGLPFAGDHAAVRGRSRHRPRLTQARRSQEMSAAYPKPPARHWLKPRGSSPHVPARSAVFMSRCAHRNILNSKQQQNELFCSSILSLVWDRPKNLFNITGYISPGQTAGENPLACLIQPWHASTKIYETVCLLALALPLSPSPLPPPPPLPLCTPSPSPPPTLPLPSFLSLLPPPPLWCHWPLPSRLSGSIVSNLNTVFLSLWCISWIILIVIFAKKYAHFSKQFMQTAPHNGFPVKACNLLKIVSSSLKSKYLSMNIVPSEWKVLV